MAYLVGTNVGAAVLALPFAARQAGYAGVVIACLMATAFSLVSHLYLLEAMLRTPAVAQLVGLFRTYLFRGRFKIKDEVLSRKYKTVSWAWNKKTEH